MSWKLDWNGRYRLTTLTKKPCPLCTEPTNLYARSEDNEYNVSVLCSNKCGFELYAVKSWECRSGEVEIAGIYYREENFAMYLGDNKWTYCFEDGSDITEQGGDNRVDVAEVANKLWKLTLLT